MAHKGTYGDLPYKDWPVKNVSFQIDKEKVEILDELADETNTSRSWVIKLAVDEYLVRIGRVAPKKKKTWRGNAK